MRWSSGLLFALALGCDGHVTEIVVVADTDMAVPGEIDGVEIRVTRGGDAERLATRMLDGPNPAPTVTVLRREAGSVGPIEIGAIGLRAGAEVLRNTAVVHFVEGEQLLLELPLVGTCRARVCGADDTCDHAGCRSVSRDSLPTWTGEVPRIPRDDCDATCPDGTCRDGLCCLGCFVATADGGFDCVAGDRTLACGRGGADCAVCDCSGSDACIAGACAQEGAFIDVDQGLNHACAVGGDGRAYCWGNGGDGRLGVLGSDPGGADVPTAISSDLRFVTVASGWAHSCAITTDGALYCWGTAGPAGEMPTAIETTRRWLAISVGRDYSCGITVDRSGADGLGEGELWCWGSRDGANGRPGTDESGIPAMVEATSVVDWVAVDAGTNHACAIRSNGDLYCWGTNASCEVRSPPTSREPTVAFVRENVRAVSAGDDTTCVVDADGSAWCWGRNVAGEVGVAPVAPDGGAAMPACDPVRVGSVDDFERIATGQRQTYALGAGGVLWRWPPVPAAPATPSDAFMTGWDVIDGSDNSWCTMRATALYCWGSNEYGQLGIGGLGNQARPQRVCLR